MSIEVGEVYVPKSKKYTNSFMIDWFVVKVIYPFGDAVIIGNTGQRIYTSSGFIRNSKKLDKSPLIEYSVTERINQFMTNYIKRS